MKQSKSKNFAQTNATQITEPKIKRQTLQNRIVHWGIAFSTFSLIITGLIKTFKNLSGFNLSDSVYFWVAQLHNLGFALIIFGIIGHLSAFIFKANRPLLSAMFSGKVSAKYVLHRHSLSKEDCAKAQIALQKAQNHKNGGK